METRVVDLVHTKLFLSFDYLHQWVNGTAVLSLTPYAYALSQVKLDAHGFTLLRVAQLKGRDTLTLSYDYDSLKLNVSLASDLLLKDTLQLLIQYIAKPNEIKTGTGKAISDARGLYFINPLGTDPNKPRQIWSQGETEYNSGWFPTVDAPNEKHTQDIYLTVEEKETTLSNGLLKDTKHNLNGTKTDHWQQLKPHAPYLTMIAIGNFIVTKDTWRNKEVSYYLEPAYAPYARTIFGKTPQMIETFSKITGVDYPWDKFSQVVARDFVSGAMENTSAVLHYEMVQHTDREHLDNPHEDIIVHELFHHWFGDLVTCRSWSNLPLNESFATYGEYLYNEYTYGKDYADMVFAKNLEAYLRSKNKYQESPIRNYYAEADDVFDVVSYQKGSWILHQLRNEVGDSAFFKGINRYLTQNAYGTTDIHNLRQAMEWASGKDLQVFFTQWFLGKGHPELQIALKRNTEKNRYELEVKQVQDSSFGLFTINTELAYVSLHADGTSKVKTIPITIQQATETIVLPPIGHELILSYWIDPKGNIPGVIVETKDPNSWMFQAGLATGYQAKQRAIKAISNLPYEKDSSIQLKLITQLLSSSLYYDQLTALDLIEKLDTFYAHFEPQIIDMALHNKVVEVRDNSMYLIGYKGKGELAKSILLQGLKDSSYEVMATSLQSLSITDETLCLQKCIGLESIQTATLQRTISWLYASHAKDNKNAYYKSVLGKFGMYRNSILNAYFTYLRNQNKAVLEEALPILENYYTLSSDRDKAKTFRSFLKTLQAKSKETEFFESVTFKAFKEKVQTDYAN